MVSVVVVVHDARKRGGGVKALQVASFIVWLLAFSGNALLFVYVEWSYLRQSFLQVFNPFLHIEVVLTLITLPLFWILLAVTALGLFAMKVSEKHADGGASQ
jgi:hypothetical protein